MLRRRWRSLAGSQNSKILASSPDLAQLRAFDSTRFGGHEPPNDGALARGSRRHQVSQRGYTEYLVVVDPGQELA